MKLKRRNFTIVELMVVVAFFTIAGGILYIGAHFLAKVW